jgi:hypothetical protein
LSAATPQGVKVNYRHITEPQLDSCDGMPSTRGWTNAVVQVNFDWKGSAEQLISLVNRNIVAVGWGNFTSAVENFVPGGAWTKQLTKGATAHAILGIEPDSTWTLLAQAPPTGHQATGC